MDKKQNETERIKKLVFQWFLTPDPSNPEKRLYSLQEIADKCRETESYLTTKSTIFRWARDNEWDKMFDQAVVDGKHKFENEVASKVVDGNYNYLKSIEDSLQETIKKYDELLKQVMGAEQIKEVINSIKVLSDALTKNKEFDVRVKIAAMQTQPQDNEKEQDITLKFDDSLPNVEN